MNSYMVVTIQNRGVKKEIISLEDDKMKYRLEGKVLEKEKEIERLLNLPMNEFEQELIKCTKKELYEITYRAFEVVGRIESVKYTSIEKDIGKEIILRLD